MFGGGDKVPSVGALDKPENLDSLLREDRGDDCTSCRIIGGGTFIALGAYNYYSGMSQLEKKQAEILRSGSRFGMRSRKMAIGGLSLSLCYLGIWRIFR